MKQSWLHMQCLRKRLLAGFRKCKYSSEPYVIDREHKVKH